VLSFGWGCHSAFRAMPRRNHEAENQLINPTPKAILPQCGRVAHSRRSV